MRNIIGWSSPRDSAFAERLSRRVTKVIAPLIKTKRESASTKERRAAFNRLSPVDKRQALFETALSHFKRARYKTLDLRHGQNENLSTPFVIHSSMRPGAFAAAKRVGARFKFGILPIAADDTGKSRKSLLPVASVSACTKPIHLS